MLKLLIFILICVVRQSEIQAACSTSLRSEYIHRMGGSHIEWPCHATKNIYINSGRYIPRNVIVTRTQIHKTEAFVALPRYKPGVPFTLGRIDLSKNEEYYTAIRPYPSWLMQEEGNCDNFQSIVDVFLDGQELLWVLDVGVVNTIEQPIRRCPPKIVAIDVRSGKVMKIIDLATLIVAKSRLQYLTVDYDPAGNAYVYIADAGSQAILVHNCLENKNYRIVLPAPVCSTTKMDVLYFVLIRKSCGTVTLYFTFLHSPRLFSIKADHLRKGNGSGAVIDVGPKPNDQKIVLLGSDNGASLFLRYKGQSDIYMWNTETSFKSSNFLEVQRGGDCRYSTQVLPGHRRFMWTLESNFHDFIEDKVGCNGASIVLHPVVRECED